MVHCAAKYYREQNNKLFQEWKEVIGTADCRVKQKIQTIQIDHKNSVFIKDGVVCPEQWFTQNVRPLFLLKEAYGGCKDWDLINDHLCRDYTASKMWKRISLWTKGLMATAQNYIEPFTDDDSSIEYYGNKYIKQIAVINIKKSNGTKNSDMNVIRAYAEFDKDRLKKQIELCNPTVIICGYTMSALTSILGENIRANYNSNLFYKITINNHDVIVLDYWHPANQYPDIMNYYCLMNMYHSALRSDSMSTQ